MCLGAAVCKSAVHRLQEQNRDDREIETTGRRLIPHGMQRVPGYHLCEGK